MRQLLRAVIFAAAIALPLPAAMLLAPPVQAEVALLDINSASKDQLDALPGPAAAVPPRTTARPALDETP